MRAVVYTEFGPSSVLSLVERETPEPGVGEVRVRLVRAGVNPTDWKARSGATARGPLAAPTSPGQDGAGVVDAIGLGVDGLAVGDRVWVYLAQHDSPYGTAAEYTVVPAAHAVRMPEHASFELGASLGVPALSSHRALTSGDVARLAPGAFAGRYVLVQGGAGAVGNAAIQLAAWAGASVITTVSSAEKAALAAAAGAQHIVDYREQDAAAAIREVAPDGVDLIVEVAPAANNELDQAVVRGGGTVAFYANNGGDTLQLALRQTFSLNLRYQGVLLYKFSPEHLDAAAADVSAAVAAGALRVGEDAGLPITHFALEDTAAAHDAVEAGLVGKAVIDVAVA